MREVCEVKSDKQATSHLRPSIVMMSSALLLAVGPGALMGAPAVAGSLSGVLQPYAMSAVWAGRPVVVEVWLDQRQPASLASLSLAGLQIQFETAQRVQGQIAGGKLQALAALPGVACVTLPTPVVGPRLPLAGMHASQGSSVRPQQAIFGFGANVSEGVQLTNASSYQSLGIAGAGANIGIIAEGFAGAVDAEIPTPAQVSFRADGTMGTDALGTAAAEVAADMAPQANFILIAVDTALSLRQAINYVATNRYTAVVNTVGTVDGPFDGSDMISQAVATASDSGVLWVQASGDLAQRHWQGTFVDVNSDTFCDIETNTGVSLDLPAGEFTAFLSWYETAGAVTSQDYNLQLWQGTTLIADSGVSQNGATPPRETLIAQVITAGVHELRIKAVRADLMQPDKFQLYTPAANLPVSVAVAATSLPIPAMSSRALTVGATAGTAGVPPAPGIDDIELYSGQGPTVGGSRKPNMVGPDRVTTSLAAYTPFLSTSASAAHVAGAAALLYSENPSRTGADLRRIILMLAKPLPTDTSPPSNTYGEGRLTLQAGRDTDLPTVTIIFPQNSTTINTRTPLIRASLIDTGTGIDPASILLAIDGRQLTGYSFDATSGVLTFQVTTSLTLASHQLTLSVADQDGNRSVTALSNFRVALPRMDAGIHLFSLPYTYAPGSFPDPSQVFGLSSEEVRLARWWPGDTQYHLYPDPYATFDPPDASGPAQVVPQPPAGIGYFVRLPRATTLNITGAPVAGLTQYDINLLMGSREPRGWNMIGCPFLTPVDFGSVQFVTAGKRETLAEAISSGVTDGVLFGFRSTASGGYYTFSADPFSAMLEPFQGYWLRVRKDTTLVIYAPVIATQTATPRPTEGGEGWRLQLVATANGVVEPCNYIGMNTKATAAYSPFWAVGKPPAVDSSLRAALVERDWGDESAYYAQIVRPASGRQEWDMEIACAQPNSEVSLRWPELNATVPAGVTLLLEDLDTGEEIYMRTSAGYSFNSGPQGSTRRVRIIASTEAVGGLSLSGVSAQGITGGGVAFTYALSQPAEVTAEIRNISGLLIKQFSPQLTAGGAVELLVWNGRSDRGSKVPAGRYVVRLTARTDKGQTVQAIRPFEVFP